MLLVFAWERSDGSRRRRVCGQRPPMGLRVMCADLRSVGRSFFRAASRQFLLISVDMSLLRDGRTICVVKLVENFERPVRTAVSGGRTRMSIFLLGD